MTLRLRLARPADADAIHALTAAAFAGAAHADGTEPDVIRRLRAAGDLTLSLVAEDRGIVGHVALSTAAIGGEAGWDALGPISVAPDRQGQGIGRMLVEGAVADAQGRGRRGLVLIGDPALYGRFGFRSGLCTWRGLPAALVQHLTLAGPDPEGEVAFHPAFDGPA